MSMWRTSAYRSPCEVVREINDMFQGDSFQDQEVRKLLAEVEAKAKDMSIHLSEYEPNYYKHWEKNKDANDDARFRQKDNNTPKETYKYHKL